MTAAPSSDVFSTKKRSAIMRAVKSKDTKPELQLRRALHRIGFRYRLNVKDLPGKPDLLFPKYGVALFVHGCFWHGHQCKRGRRIPKTNTVYWREKIRKNRDRDCKNKTALEALGWRVLTVWECEIPTLDLATLSIRAD